MYRPTVRYDDIYKEYVENIFNATHLDRSQIIRAALFIAGHTEKFSKIMEPYLKRGVSLPRPIWSENDKELWINQKPEHSSKPSELPIKSIKNEQNVIEKTRSTGPKIFNKTPGIMIKVSNKEVRRHSL